jgi:riboflavin synthase
VFTGIVEAQGVVSKCASTGKDVRASISARTLDLSDVRVGDSIAVSGCCLTVVKIGVDSFDVDVSQETLNCTAGFATGDPVNLEKSLRLSDRLGGHLVSGHVDGVGEVVQMVQVGESWLLEVRIPPQLAKYLARKGAITVNGVSLTVNRVEQDRFAVNLIPHTVAVTNLRSLTSGSRVNLEVDLLARYVERLLAAERG